MSGNENELEAILRTLTSDQLTWVAARMGTRTDVEAAQACGIAAKTAANWINKDDINRAVALSRLDGINVAREQLRRLASRAVSVIGDELEARRGSPRRLDAALAALDRIGLNAKTAVELSGSVGVIRGYVNVSPDDWDTPALPSGEQPPALEGPDNGT